MIVLLTITVDNHGARVTFIRYVPIWVRHPDYVVLPAGTAWRNDPADAAALRASYERTVAEVGRSPGIQPIPAHLLSAGALICRCCTNQPLAGRARARSASLDFGNGSLTWRMDRCVLCGQLRALCSSPEADHRRVGAVSRSRRGRRLASRHEAW
jgi:hypothetical protein